MSRKKSLKILFVEDNTSDAELAIRELKKGGLDFEHLRVETREEFLKTLNDFKPDLIISDYMMPVYNGMKALLDAKEFFPDIPFILFTGSINEETAVECLKAGADDYIIKEHLTRLPYSVKEALIKALGEKEKRAAGLLLKENEEKLQSIFRAAPVGIGVVVNRVFIEVNDTFCQMTGYSRKELVGRKSDMIYASSEDFVNVGIEKYSQIQERGTGSLETRFKCKDGKIINVLLSSTPLDQNDLLKGVTFTVMDITERKRAEEALAESETKYRQLVTQSPDGIFIADLSGRFVSVNSSICATLKYSEEELLSVNLLDIIPEKYHFMHKQRLMSVVSGKTTAANAEYEVTGKDGQNHFIEVISVPYYKGKEIVGFQGIARDVTSRKVMEAEIRESEKRYKELFLNNPVPSYIFDTDTLEFVEVNEAALQSYGYSLEEFASMTLRELRSEEDLPALLESVKYLGSGIFHSRSMRHRRKDGSLFPVDILSHELPVKNGKKTRLVMVKDITEEVEAEINMRIAKEKAEANDKLKTTFLNNISHEVRTPLNGILGFAEIISQTDLPDEEKNVSYTMLHESADRLLNTITNYMDISLINSGTMSVNSIDFFPDDTLAELNANFSIKCLARNLKLILEIPERRDKLRICSDQEIVKKILVHLLNNAIKFTEKGVIKFGYTIRKNELEFFVKDTGIGIGEESREDIFKHFIKEDRGPHLLSEGSGLGLAISKGLAGLLGGKLTVESEKFKGSTFFLTLPVIGEREDDKLFHGVDDQNGSRKSNSILVAEDDTVNFYYIKALLQKSTPADIIYAANGKEAVDKFRQHPDVGLILMDIKMPVMDGLEATRQIKAINKDVPVIAITAYAMVGDEARILAAGCDEYLIKPINKKLFLDKISRYVVMK